MVGIGDRRGFAALSHRSSSDGLGPSGFVPLRRSTRGGGEFQGILRPDLQPAAGNSEKSPLEETSEVACLFPNGLNLAIQRSGLTLAIVARCSKLSEREIETWASGRARLPAEAAQRLACVLKVTIADLMFGPPATPS